MITKNSFFGKTNSKILSLADDTKSMIDVMKANNDFVFNEQSKPRIRKYTGQTSVLSKDTNSNEFRLYYKKENFITLGSADGTSKLTFIRSYS